MPTVEASIIIQGVYIVTPTIHYDPRGFLLESWRKDWIAGSREMVQSNRADRQAGSLVGIHYHLQHTDYWYVPFGCAHIALCDLRVGSPTEGAALTLEIGDHNHKGIYIPPGVGHAFYALTNITITYLVDEYYDQNDEFGVAWDDPTLSFKWPTLRPLLSERDKTHPFLEAIRPENRPKWYAPNVIAFP